MENYKTVNEQVGNIIRKLDAGEMKPEQAESMINAIDKLNKNMINALAHAKLVESKVSIPFFEDNKEKI